MTVSHAKLAGNHTPARGDARPPLRGKTSGHATGGRASPRAGYGISSARSGSNVASVLVCVSLSTSFAALPASAASENYVANGSFDNGLEDWTYRYDWKGQGFYSSNHERVEVLDKFGGRSTVLRLDCRPQGIADNQGVKVDSKAIPFNPDYEHTLHVVARSNGPGVRILVEGYRWLPGLRPEREPGLRDLRKYYKFKYIGFGKPATGGGASIGDRWTRGRVNIPSTPIDKMSPLSLKKLKKVQFLVVHIVAIAGSAGDVYVDDVKLVRGRKLPRLPSTSR